ncbi:MAG: hypothetical protein WDO70_10360 [Alphaproteobacteria bacterium]
MPSRPIISSDKADSLQCAAIAYLTLPVVLVELGWLAPWIGIPCAILTLWCVWPGCAFREKIPLWHLAGLALAAIAIVAFTGISPLIANGSFMDLAKHRWLYNDLVRHDWPVVFHGGQEREILRYGIGFYAVPALLSKLAGHPVQFLLCAWLALGVWIFLLLGTRHIERATWVAFAAFILLFFSGLDVLGRLFLSAAMNEKLHIHIEEWARIPFGWIMPSQENSLSLLPQHAVAAWLGASLIHQGWNKPWFKKRAVGIFTVLAFWSPFTALSFAAIVAALHLRNIVAILSTRNIAALAPLALLAAYYRLGPFLQAEWNISESHRLFEYAWRYALFVVLEFGVFVVAAYAVRRSIDPPAAAAAGLLLALPFLYVGRGNEIMLHGTILPLTLMIFYVIDTLRLHERSVAKMALKGLVIIGLTTGFSYAVIDAARKPNPGDYEASIASMPPELRPQYIAPLPESASWLLRR